MINLTLKPEDDMLGGYDFGKGIRRTSTSF